MCQNPKSPNPSLPNRGGEEHHEQRPQRQQQEQDRDRDRDLRKQALVHELSAKLASGDPSAQIEAARDVRRIARASARARSAFAVAAVVDPLVSMLAAADRAAKESALLALLNLAVRNERNKEVIVKSGAIPHLIELLKSENNNLRELATAAVLTLSASPSNRSTIIAAGAVPFLVQILISGSIQGRVDAVTALYNLSNCNEVAHLTFSVEATRPLLTLLKDSKKYSKFAEKATALLEILSHCEEGIRSISETDSGILTLVETVEEGSLLSTEHAVGILLSLCKSSREKYREIILNEGPIPGLLLLTVDGSQTAQHKARFLLEILRLDSQKRAASEDLETIVYKIAARVDGPEKAEKTAKKLLQDMVRRNMERNMARMRNRAASSSPKILKAPLT